MNIVQIYKKFPTQEHCLEYLEQVRWNGQPKCPYCKSEKFSNMKNEYRYHCNTCNTSFSVTVGTIFHRTHLDLQKWFLALSIVLNARKGISARQLSRDLEVNKNTAWSMGMRIRKAMLSDGKLLMGVVEMDETYVGGKPRKGNKKENGSNKRGRGTRKTPIVGIIQRDGDVKARVSKKLDSKKLSTLIRRNVSIKDSVLITDEYRGYSPISKFIKHKVINHTFEYVNNDIHTNNIESFWAILKRGIVGQYHKVSVRYLQRYIDEFAYRFNNRKNENVFEELLIKALGGVA